MWVYYVKENTILRAPGQARLPTEVLWPTGWRPYPPVAPTLWNQLEPVTLPAAKTAAAAEGLPTDGWDS